MGSLSSPHFAIFPFMSQGHHIPLLYLSRLLRQRSASVTIFTTAGNSKRTHEFLRDADVSVVELPFPQNIQGVPRGVENTDKLPSMSCFFPFVAATKEMQQSFEKSLETLNPPVSCIISDGFLGWTLESARKFCVPRLVFFGMGNFSSTMYQILGRFSPHSGTSYLDEQFSIPDFPNLKLTRNDFDPPFSDIEPSGPYVDFMMDNIMAMAMSHGVIVNSFYELESCYVDYWNEKIGPRAWCIGPLCMEGLEKALHQPSYNYIKWLDEKLQKGESVLYVAFGTQAEISKEQLHEIAEGLEKSHVSFLWVLKSKGSDLLRDLESKVQNRGLIVQDWVDQPSILLHECVKCFLSHCGWNSVMESLCAGVPILAMPMMAEQHLNARFVAEELETGLRIMPRDGSMRGFVAAEEVEGKVRELMGGGEKAAEIRRKVKEYGKAADDAVKEGGSSWRALDLLMNDVCRENISLPCTQAE